MKPVSHNVKGSKRPVNGIRPGVVADVVRGESAAKAGASAGEIRIAKASASLARKLEAKGLDADERDDALKGFIDKMAANEASRGGPVGDT